MKRILLVLTLTSAAWPLGLLAQESTPAPTPAPAVEQSLFDLYVQGGWLMHPIALCSIGTIAVAAFCALQINRKRLIPPAQVEQLTAAMAAKDLQSAYAECEANKNPLTNALAAAILKADFQEPKFNRPEMEKAAAERLVHDDTRLTLWINYLNVFATIAPMLGLLGTVTGMITAFNQLAAGRSEPADLAGGIGVAMITTAAGLIVGIPAMFGYFFFRNLLQGIVADIESALLGMLDAFVRPSTAESTSPSSSVPGA